MFTKLNKLDLYLTIPSIIYLIITLISGMWIRLQWVVPSLYFFNPKFAIHAHSHLAMLGWLFPVFIRFLLPRKLELSTSQKTSISVLHFLIIGMFPAFVFQGYAFWSITFSSLYLSVSYWIIVQFRTHLFQENQPLTKIAVLFYLISTIGPWLLGGSTAFGPQWLTAWISWFLHLQFNGWITFAAFALLLQKVELKPNMLSAFYVLAISTVFISLGLMFPLNTKLLTVLMALSGIALTSSAIFLIFCLIKPKQFFNYSSFFLLLLLGKSIFLGAIPFDEVQNYIHHINQARVAFTHTLLLGIASPLALLFIFKTSKIFLLFLSAAWLMIIFLWIETFQTYSAIGLHFSIQWVYLFCGIILLLSLITLFIRSFFTQNEVRLSSDLSIF